MKNTIQLLLVLLCLTACDNILEENPEAFRTPESFYETEDEIDQGIAGIYQRLRFLYNGNGQLQLRFGESRSDNTNIEITGDSGGFNDDELNEFTMDPTNARIAEYWSNNYNGITRANFVLANIDAVTFQDKDIRDARKGEALFLRTLFYFNLLRVYGAIPYITQPGSSPDQILSEAFIARDPAAMVYINILEDVQKAIDLLPETTKDAGRATKAAALMLKAKIHMAEQQYDQAIPLLEQIQTLGYSLLPNYADVFFTKNHSEGIFEIQHSPALDQGANYFRNFVPFVSGQDILGENSSPNNRGNQFKPTQNLIDLYDDADTRKAHNISIYVDDKGLDHPWASKFAKAFDASQINQQDINWQMYRYADALLMLAECYERVGGGDPMIILEEIRTRAGLPDPSLTPAEMTDMLQTIADERRRELAFEGHRFFDLLRTGKLTEVMTTHGTQQVADGLSVTANAYENIRQVVGIPQNQVDQFGFEQTQGW